MIYVRKYTQFNLWYIYSTNSYDISYLSRKLIWINIYNFKDADIYKSYREAIQFLKLAIPNIKKSEYRIMRFD